MTRPTTNRFSSPVNLCSPSHEKHIFSVSARRKALNLLTAFGHKGNEEIRIIGREKSVQDMDQRNTITSEPLAELSVFATWLLLSKPIAEQIHRVAESLIE
eukprot:TRINITY_DN2558_c0_g1_i2.p1 TRINITY_DN2558_c0_g1~~TRINITY_DN2558_c0_g1_i2.p1  ORF type:complete len:101 (-),score=4.64 TRINITY_DN2558_c0_g1_i2:74-376(-)